MSGNLDRVPPALYFALQPLGPAEARIEGQLCPSGCVLVRGMALLSPGHSSFGTPDSASVHFCAHIVRARCYVQSV